MAEFILQLRVLKEGPLGIEEVKLLRLVGDRVQDGLGDFASQKLLAKRLDSAARICLPVKQCQQEAVGGEEVHRAIGLDRLKLRSPVKDVQRAQNQMLAPLTSHADPRVV